MSTSTSNLGLVKPDGPDRALVAVINENMNKIDQYAGEVNDSLGAVEDGMAIVADGNTHAAITSGQFVYVRNHSTLTQGLYTATANIAANATLSTSNLTADPSGGLNALNNKITTKEVQLGTIGNSSLSQDFSIPNNITVNEIVGFRARHQTIGDFILPNRNTYITINGSTITLEKNNTTDYNFLPLIMVYR